MIKYTKFVLDNGLRVVVHENESTPMVAVNLLYNVGARDESPEKTGFAHLFEHLMFSGSENVKDFDDAIQLAGGDSNAFTNNDTTNFYNVLPAENIETVFWLESDRMKSLNINARSLEIQQKVVVEEFKENCLNQPFGDVWHHLSDLAYKVHPYRWPTIGKVPDHVEQATLDDVQSFYKKFYRPNNAILAVAGKVTVEQIKTLANKWFGDIPASNMGSRELPEEPRQLELHVKEQSAKVPVDALYMAFHIPARNHPDYYAIDLLSDVLCNGQSSRLYRKLHKVKHIFTEIDAYITGNIDPGLLIIEGKPMENVSMEAAEAAIWEELELIKRELISKAELEKYKNKVESNLRFSETNVLNIAINLSFFELLDDVELINREADLYLDVKAEDIRKVAGEILTRENCSELYYRSSENPAVA